MERDDLHWFTSSYSGGSGTECVEAARLPGGATAVRDSKLPGRARLAFSGAVWSAFLNTLSGSHEGGPAPRS
ncbi:DUF397 domain-containing protein [Streptomyces sp. t39]|uniref:DUF397 domain-containing protein n=1 Tax=Streptomyces sp. t39 TaxID=1828156 RepID=UPI0011CE8C53|nr:DUF397 domain-containing protein [Streptomyces sp. t39]TXS51845.1 DUF397 domain-containing protein [Streptomyces sp. t39]